MNTQTDIKSSVSNVLIVVTGGGLYVALGFIAFLIVANLLDPEQFGLFSLSLAVLVVLQEICGSGFDLATVKISSGHGFDPTDRGIDVLKTAVKLKFIAMMIIAGLLFALRTEVSELLTDSQDLVTPLKWVSLGVVAGGMTTSLFSMLQAKQQFLKYTIYRVFLNVAKVAMLAFFYVTGMTLALETAIFIWVSAFFIVLITGSKDQLGTLTPVSARHSWFEAKSIMTMSFWLVSSHLLFALYSRIDMFLIARFWSLSDVGTYAIAWNLAFTMDMVTFSLIMTLLPKASKMRSRAELTDYMTDSIKLSALLCLPFAIAYVLSDWFISSFFQQYAGAVNVFKILFIGALVTLFVHPLYLILYTRNRPQLMVFANAVLVLVMAVAGLSLIPAFGVVGAAWASAVARIIGCAVILFFVFSVLAETDVDTSQ